VKRGAMEGQGEAGGAGVHLKGFSIIHMGGGRVFDIQK